MFKIYNNHRIILLSSTHSALRMWTQEESCSNKSDFLSLLPRTPSGCKTKQKCYLLFQSLVCSTFTFSTEPLPRMAHDDNDFALHAGEFSRSVSQSLRQTAPALEIVPAVSLWDGRQWSQQQVSPLTSPVCRSEADGTGTRVCVRLHTHHPSNTCMLLRQESFVGRQFSII